MAKIVACATLQPVVTETVFHYAIVPVLILGFCSTTPRTSYAMSWVLVLLGFSRFAVGVNVPSSLRWRWIGSKTSYLDTVVPVFLVGTNGYLQRCYLTRTHKCMVYPWTPPLKPWPYPQHTLQQCCTLSYCCDCIKSEWENSPPKRG